MTNALTCKQTYVLLWILAKAVSALSIELSTATRAMGLQSSSFQRHIETTAPTNVPPKIEADSIFSMNNNYRMKRKAEYRFLDEARMFLPAQLYQTQEQVRPSEYNLQSHQQQDRLFGSTVLPSDDFKLSNLSVSSKSLLARYEHLSEKERDRFHQKVQAEAKASQPLDPKYCLRVLYVDEHICVTVKPSGVLSVPGPRQNPSLAQLVYQQFPPLQRQQHHHHHDDDVGLTLDQTVVHRLDMDTSGILMFARSMVALRQLQADFRNHQQQSGDDEDDDNEKKSWLFPKRQLQQQQHQRRPRRIHKVYHALVNGHVTYAQGEIDVAIERNPWNAPFMRVAQPKQSINNGCPSSPITFPKKWQGQAPKPSLTEYQVLSHEYLSSSTTSSSSSRSMATSSSSYPVTRLALTPRTGRTHQLRVHCAQVLNHAIVGDVIYGKESLLSSTEEQPSTPLCLHAYELRCHHPVTGAPMIFQAKAPF